MSPEPETRLLHDSHLRPCRRESVRAESLQVDVTDARTRERFCGPASSGSSTVSARGGGRPRGPRARDPFEAACAACRFSLAFENSLTACAIKERESADAPRSSSARPRGSSPDPRTHIVDVGDPVRRALDGGIAALPETLLENVLVDGAGAVVAVGGEGVERLLEAPAAGRARALVSVVHARRAGCKRRR